MLLSRIRTLIATRRRLLLAVGGLLIVLLPFIAVHFRCDGLEDEPALRLRSADATVQFEQDDRADHPHDRETTVFAQTSASIDAPDTLSHGLDLLAALALALVPLTLALIRLVEPVERGLPQRVPTQGGAPPPQSIRRRRPPPTAPPLMS